VRISFTTTYPITGTNSFDAASGTVTRTIGGDVIRGVVNYRF